ncbi:OmpH family outer membrane protein [Candidatus Thiothrix anitrata]|uniref:OmpH family outer membrane protein n=1 Tax=Candidatus Thiothrix anitrata TaxID=2823902 RepID=A0ABX7X3C5_9GAMM|nr:OmpH family outer membrane protein [Candidatus Thiothrix anitrata]QTR49902.1 OmpH family outer membrane protein [Candidatus Thiothrix anitrata]
MNGLLTFIQQAVRHGLLAVLLLPALVLAENNAAERPFRIAIVDVSVLLENSPQSKAANEKLKSTFVPREESLNQEQQAIQRLEEALTLRIDAGTISEVDKLEQQRELRDRKRKNVRALEDFREEVRTARDLAVDSLQSQIVLAIGEVRETEQIDVVLRESDYIVASNRIEITSKVMQHLEQKFQADQATATSAETPRKE